MTITYNHAFEREHKYSNLIQLLQYRARKQPKEVAFQFIRQGTVELERITYQELERQVKAIAALLQEICVPGDRALLIYPSGLEFVKAFLGCLYAGVIAVPAYPPRRNQKISRLQTLVSEAQASIALSTESLLANISSRFADSYFSEISWVTTNNISTELGNSWQEFQVKKSTVAFLQYTSGSTGKPKGVIITHDNLLNNERLIAQAFGHTNNTVVVGWLPLFHDMGLIGNVLQPLYLGRPCILMSPVDFLQRPLRWLQAISHFQATTSGGPNFAYDLCVRKITAEQRANLDLSKWEVAFNGAEPVRTETLDRFAASFKDCGFRKEAFYPCYGMAETTLFVTGNSKKALPVVRQVDKHALEQHKAIPVSMETDQIKNSVQKLIGCGHTRLDTKLKIVDPKTLVECKPSQVGEIWVSGAIVAQGYWNRTIETEQTFKAFTSDSHEGPFLRTGDLGFIQDNELFVTGRLKDVIIIRGQNYYPQDIEQTIENSHPALRPGCSAAFAVEIKTTERLVIVQEVERSYLRKLNMNEIVDNFIEAVTAEHGLQVYATVLVKPGSIPKTSSGKIKRFACRTKFLNGSLDVVRDWSENPQHKAEFLNLKAEIESVFNKANQQINQPELT